MQTSQPVRERLLLVLPTGELHEFVCSKCATSLGKRTVTGPAVAPPAKRPRPTRPTPRTQTAALILRHWAARAGPKRYPRNHQGYNRIARHVHGHTSLGLPSLGALMAAPDLDVVGVVTQPDRPKGRDLQLAPSPVKELALRRGQDGIAAGNELATKSSSATIRAAKDRIWLQ